MSGSLILGVDIGSRGAIALVSWDGASLDLVDVFDMPCLNDGPAGRRAVNPPLLAEIVAKAHASKAYVELVGARPGEGAVGAFAFGRSRGVVEGVLGALGVPVAQIAPAAWKRAVELPKAGTEQKMQPGRPLFAGGQRKLLCSHGSRMTDAPRLR
jgi:crossover junction endodeoxyribonuclease RuvC